MSGLIKQVAWEPFSQWQSYCRELDKASVGFAVKLSNGKWLNTYVPLTFVSRKDHFKIFRQEITQCDLPPSAGVLADWVELWQGRGLKFDLSEGKVFLKAQGLPSAW